MRSSVFFCVFKLLGLPIELARQECRFKRKRLEKTRDERAEALGSLVEMRDPLGRALDGQDDLRSVTLQLRKRVPLLPPSEANDEFELLHESYDNDNDNDGNNKVFTTGDIIALLASALARQSALHAELIVTRGLSRPSRLTLLWPRFVLLPPLVLYGARTLYASRAGLRQVWDDAWATVDAFVRAWLV